MQVYKEKNGKLPHVSLYIHVQVTLGQSLCRDMKRKIGKL